MREEHLAAGIDTIEQRAIFVIASNSAEADDGKQRRSEDLELRIFAYPTLELLCHCDVCPQRGAQAFESEIPKYKPELKRTEPMSERDAVIHQVVGTSIFGRSQIFRSKR